jgi:phosphate transport system protein
MPMRSTLERSLVTIQDDLLRLASMVDQAITLSTQALMERNRDLATSVSANDVLLNQTRFATEERCYHLLATQQLVATNLRVIVGTVSVATNLERIGDHAAGIARLTLRMIDSPPLRPITMLPQMGETARIMVREAVDAFLKHDVALAEQVISRDRTIDQLHRHAYDELIACMMRDSTTVERATLLLWVSHNYERIGDRATNICERAIYVATGELKEYPSSP